MPSEEILADGLLKKVGKDQNILEVAIGEGMEFTIHGDTKNKTKKNKYLVMNNSKVCISTTFLTIFVKDLNSSLKGYL